MAATLQSFAEANDSVAAVAGKLAKQAILADYFRGLDDDDLARAVRYALGRAFPSSSERVLNIGGRIMGDAVLALLKAEPDALRAAYLQKGEIGEGAASLWPGGAELQAVGTPLLLRDVEEAFDELSRIGAPQVKREALLRLLQRCAGARELANLIKAALGDMRTGVQEGVAQGAVAQAFAAPLAEVRRACALTGDLDAVAILARHGRLESARFTLFHPIQFMLATPQETPDEAAATMAGREFYVEDKLDGIRAQVHKSGGRLAIFTRTMDRADAAFPEVAEALSRVPGEFLLDGEIVPWRDGQVLPFVHIQKRLGKKAPTARDRLRHPLAFIAFDLLQRDGESLLDAPLRRRRQMLLELAQGAGEAPPGLVLAPWSTAQSAEEVERLFEAARARRNEGIVLKDPESAYSMGRRGKAWLKLKTHLPTLDCVVTAAEYGHGKRRGVLSDYTFAVWDRPPDEEGAALLNIGKAYSGVTDKEIAELTALFLTISTGQRGHVHSVRPQVVLEIAFDQVQKSARHASGFALRFPRIKRIRTDKAPRDADLLSRVREIHDSHANFGHLVEEPETPVQPSLFG